MTTTPTLGAHVRAATPADLPAVERLVTQSGLPLDGLRDAFPSFVVAQAGDDIVGAAGLEVCCNNALLRSVAVADGSRSHGVGRALVTRVIGDAEARGISALYLLTTTADRYFPTFGFRQVSRDQVPDDIRTTAQFLPHDRRLLEDRGAILPGSVARRFETSRFLPHPAECLDVGLLVAREQRLHAGPAKVPAPASAEGCLGKR